MKPRTVILFIIYCIFGSVILAVAVSHVWRIWRTRSIEETLRLKNFGPKSIAPDLPFLTAEPPSAVVPLVTNENEK